MKLTHKHDLVCQSLFVVLVSSVHSYSIKYLHHSLMHLGLVNITKGKDNINFQYTNMDARLATIATRQLRLAHLSLPAVDKCGRQGQK